MAEVTTVPHPTPPPISTTFPQEIEVSLVLKVAVADQEERDSWLEAGTNVIAIDALADVFDIFVDNDISLVSVNNLTQQQIKLALQARP